MITIFTHGDGGVVREDGTAASPGAENGGDGASPAASVAGLASVVEMQEREIEGLREELSEALSRVPQGGKDGGGMSALEEALRNRVRNVARCGVQEMSRLCWHAPADRTTTPFSGWWRRLGKNYNRGAKTSLRPGGPVEKQNAGWRACFSRPFALVLLHRVLFFGVADSAQRTCTCTANKW